MEKILIVILEACDFKSCEVHALTENIIKEYSVEFKRKVKDNETISV